METKHCALIGDVGGTNIRLQLIAIQLDLNDPQIIKEEKFKVKDYDVFEDAIRAFLKDIKPTDFPKCAAIGIAGPVSKNTVSLANVGKWGLLNGDQLAISLKIPKFQFLNDFEAASYGILTLPEQQFVSVNGLKADPTRSRGIMGPGTGLGNSVLYPIKKGDVLEIVVIPSEGGHTSFPVIDQETQQYFEFFKKEANLPYISLERSFCGPSFPYMFKFFAQKYPEDQEAKHQVPTSEVIFERAIKPDAPRVYDSVVRLFIKIYSEAVANFTTQHVATGGMYLIGGITNSIFPKIQGSDMFATFKKNHPEVESLVKDVPVMVCKVVELGMRGAFFIARRILSQQ